MQIIELDLQPDTVIKCPFCGKSLIDENGLHQCPHLLFHACDFGPFFVRSDFPYKFGEGPNEEDTDEEVYVAKMFWSDIKEIEVPNAFCFALVNHASPGMCGSGFTGFVGLCQYEI